VNRTVEVKNMLSDFPDFECHMRYIYALFNEDDQCIYVGQSANLRRRIYQHLADGKDFCRIEINHCPDVVANATEADTIVRLNPSLNKTLPPSYKYTTMTALKQSVVRAITDNEHNLDIRFTGKTKKGMTAKYILTTDSERLVFEIASLLKDK